MQTLRKGREALALRINQNGTESTALSTNSSFVIVEVPLIVLGEVPEGGASFQFSIGSFRGWKKELRIRTGAPVKLSFRIPQELFRPRERLSLEVVVRDEAGTEKVLWEKRYEAGWLGSVPHLDPLTDYSTDAPEEPQ